MFKLKTLGFTDPVLMDFQQICCIEPLGLQGVQLTYAEISESLRRS